VHHETARRIRESIPNRGATGDLALARTWVAIADSRYQGAIRPEMVRPAYENAARILGEVQPSAADRKDLLTETGRVHQRLGAYFTGAVEHDPARALKHHRAAEQALIERAALDPHDAVAKRNLADQLVMTATLQNSIGDGAGALGGTTRAVAVLRELAAADADNIEAQHDLAFAYTQLARANANLRRWPDATAALDAANAIHTHLIQRDPTNREEHRDIASFYGIVSNLYKQQGDAAKAEKFSEMGKHELALLQR
jgi:tetratricopeptide (TPR) repeat protein